MLNVGLEPNSFIFFTITELLQAAELTDTPIKTSVCGQTLTLPAGT